MRTWGLWERVVVVILGKLFFLSYVCHKFSFFFPFLKQGIRNCQNWKLESKVPAQWWGYHEKSICCIHNGAKIWTRGRRSPSRALCREPARFSTFNHPSPNFWSSLHPSLSSFSLWHWALPMTYFFAVFLYLERLLVRFLKRTHFVLRTKKEQQHKLKSLLENYFKNGHPPCK